LKLDSYETNLWISKYVDFVLFCVVESWRGDIIGMSENCRNGI